MRLTFTKMHGCGNDYIFFDCFEKELYDPETLALILSDRRFGIGGDGIVLIEKSDVADAKMRMFNADGSEGLMCGNALRCVGKYLYEHGYVKDTHATVETLSGIKTLDLSLRNGKVNLVRINMGRAILTPADIPVRLEGERVMGKTLAVAGGTYTIHCVSMGNPHCVLFVDDWQDFDLNHADIVQIGTRFEHDPLFPARVNTEFVRILGKKDLQMRVFERGSGETFACGTGACASVVAAVECGHFEKGQDVTVHLRGGELIVNYTDEAVLLTGPATQVFCGVIEK